MHLFAAATVEQMPTLGAGAGPVETESASACDLTTVEVLVRNERVRMRVGSRFQGERAGMRDLRCMEKWGFNGVHESRRSGAKQAKRGTDQRKWVRSWAGRSIRLHLPIDASVDVTSM
jgi:hypothetical protein